MKFDYSTLAQGDYVEIFETYAGKRDPGFMLTSEQAKNKSDEYSMGMEEAGMEKRSILIQKRSANGDLKGGYVIPLKEIIKSVELQSKKADG